MAEDNKTTMYLVGGGLLIAILFAMSKKSSTSSTSSTPTSNKRISSLDTKGLTRLAPITPVGGGSVSTTTTTTKLRKVGSTATTNPATPSAPAASGPPGPSTNPATPRAALSDSQKAYMAAHPPEDAPYYATVKISSGTVPLRVEPNLTNPDRGRPKTIKYLKNGDRINVFQKEEGESVLGNDVWYRTPHENPHDGVIYYGFVPSAYMSELVAQPALPEFAPYHATVKIPSGVLPLRSSPYTETDARSTVIGWKSNIIKNLNNGDRVEIIGAVVEGSWDDRWYKTPRNNLFNGVMSYGYVPARYMNALVDNPPENLSNYPSKGVGVIKNIAGYGSIKYEPFERSGFVRLLEHGERLEFESAVISERFNGRDVWYKLKAPNQGYVSVSYIDRITPT